MPRVAGCRGCRQSDFPSQLKRSSKSIGYRRTDALLNSALPITLTAAPGNTGARMMTAMPALPNATTVPGTRHGFLERPGCRVYFEVTGSGPAIVFAHGIGSNYMTWWQQVAHFSDRFACVTFSHRGYTPGSDIGVPDPKEFAVDLAALIKHLELPDVRLIAQSMGGLTSMEYILSHPQHKLQALVLTSTSGSIHRSSVPLPDPQRLEQWEREAAAPAFPCGSTRPVDAKRQGRTRTRRWTLGLF